MEHSASDERDLWTPKLGTVIRLSLSGSDPRWERFFSPVIGMNLSILILAPALFSQSQHCSHSPHRSFNHAGETP